MAVAAVHDTCSGDTVRGTGPHHLGLLHRHCFHDMEQKQTDDAGPKQTTVAQWVFWILKMQLINFELLRTVHSYSGRRQWHFVPVQRSDASMLDVWLILFQKTDYVVIIFLKRRKLKSKLTDKISRINIVSSQLLHKIQHQMCNKFLGTRWRIILSVKNWKSGGRDYVKNQKQS